VGAVQRLSGPETDAETVILDFVVKNDYGCSWEKTDGIHKVGDTIWLIQISKENGVLAMELPRFECTQNALFAAGIADIGDTETQAILDEFGGLPTGDTFPTGEDLADAIRLGAVLQLLKPEDILPFYQFGGGLLGGDPIIKTGCFANCGWAFSDSGVAKEVHNTSFYYSNPEIALATWWEGGWFLDGHMSAPADQRFMRCEHWKITLKLPDLFDPEDGTEPKGTLELVEMQPLEAPNTFGLDSYVWPDQRGRFQGTYPGADHIPYDFEAPYWPYGGGVYPGTLPFGYGLGLMTRFNTSQGGFSGFGRIGSGDTDRVLPWRTSVTTITENGPATFTALTGPGILSQTVPPRLGNVCGMYGFKPTDYVTELRTVFSHDNPTNIANSHAVFWTHSALMLVPTTTKDSLLQRFEFWGRSQCALPIDEMEPAYAAPVFVFYIGERLEIVYRQAERWKGGHYTMGNFWATSLDMRQNSSYTTSTTISGTHYPYLQVTAPPNPEGNVGLIIPKGVREGYILLRSAVTSDFNAATNNIGTSESKPVGVFAVSRQEAPKIVEYTNFFFNGDISDSSSSGEEGMYGLMLEVRIRYHQYWVSLYWNAQIKMTITVNAQTGAFVYEHNGPMRDWNPWDHNPAPFFYPSVPPQAVERPGYPRYHTALPDGIVLPEAPTAWGIDPIEVTFIGGV
jgi:hypothetical protein